MKTHFSGAQCASSSVLSFVTRHQPCKSSFLLQLVSQDVWLAGSCGEVCSSLRAPSCGLVTFSMMLQLWLLYWHHTLWPGILSKTKVLMANWTSEIWNPEGRLVMLSQAVPQRGGSGKERDPRPRIACEVRHQYTKVMLGLPSSR